MSNARDKANIPALNFSSTGIDDNATSTAITIDSSDNVGIGISSPSSRLEVYGTDSSSSRIEVTRNTSSMYLGSTGAGGYIQTPDANPLIIYTNGTERMRIDSSGNVGIGTSSPDNLLHIEGDQPTYKLTSTNPLSTSVGTETIADIDFEAQNNSLYRTTARIRARQDGTWSTGTANFAPTALDFFTQDNSTSDGMASPRMTINEDGNVGIGTTSPNGILELKSTGNTNFFITAGNTSASQVVLGDTDDIDVGKIAYSHNVNSMEFIVNASERMRIDSSGNVGIGTTSPSTPLQVNGTARASNFNTLSTQVVMSNNSKDWDISSVIGTIATVDSSISFELTMRERNASTAQLFRIYYIRVGTGTTFNISSAIWSVGSTAANTTISYPSAGTIRFTNSSFSVLDAQIRRISA